MMEEILLQFFVIIVLARLAGWLSERVGQPAVLGELLVGIALGPSLLGFIHPGESETLAFLAEFGIIILLFQVGLESNIYKLLRVGPAATAVALAGIALPFSLAYAVMFSLGYRQMVSLFVGAALTATSIGVTMRIFTAARQVDTTEGRLILGAAVIDDILALIMLSVLTGLLELGRVSLVDIGKISGYTILFLVGAIFIGIRFARGLIRLLDRLKIERSFAISAVVFATGLAYLAERVGLSTIIGAFAAGLVLEQTEDKEHIEDRIKPIADIVIPIFFVYAGALMDVRSVFDLKIALLMLALSGAAILGKVGAGYLLPRSRANRLVVGLGMIPRGEVVLVFAQFGLIQGVLPQMLYSTLIMVILLTTVLAPPLLRRALGRGLDPPQRDQL